MIQNKGSVWGQQAWVTKKAKTESASKHIIHNGVLPNSNGQTPPTSTQAVGAEDTICIWPPQGSIKALRCWMKLFLGFDVRIWPLLYIMKLCYSTKHIYNVNKYRIACIYVHIYQCAISCRYDAERASFATRCDQNNAWLKWCVFQKYYICILYILIFVFVFTTVNCVLDHEVCPKPLHG